MTFIEYAAALEQDRRNPESVAMARFIRSHEARLGAYLSDAMRLLPNGNRKKEDREELTQVALLGVLQAVRGHDHETALVNVKNALSRAGREAAAWKVRGVLNNPEED